MTAPDSPNGLAYMIKGWLLSRSHVPPDIMKAVDDIIIATTEQKISFNKITVPPYKDLEEFDGMIVEALKNKLEDPEPKKDAFGDELEDVPLIPADNPPAKKPRKKRRPLTPEEHATLCERLKKARASRGISKVDSDKQMALSETPRNADKHPVNDGDYIGERASTGDSTLQDTDWPDIKRMRTNGLPISRIARSYGIEEDYLLRFIARSEDRDKAASPGNL